jgi:hypothetical protein
MLNLRVTCIYHDDNLIVWYLLWGLFCWGIVVCMWIAFGMEISLIGIFLGGFSSFSSQIGICEMEGYDPN